MKRALVALGPDPNFPGLRVCDEGCRDQFDPYRLPARKTERINLRFPRPDVSVATNDNFIVTTGDNAFILSTQTDSATPSSTGNLDQITPSPE
jgi:hypothetical protein